MRLPSRRVEGLLAEEVAGSLARVNIYALLRFREYFEEVKHCFSSRGRYGSHLPGNGVREGFCTDSK